MEGTAVVKAVVSGDTVILQGRANNGPPPERQLSLSSLLAPKVARGPNGPEEVSTEGEAKRRRLHASWA